MRDGDGAAFESSEAVMRTRLVEGRFECDAEHDEACLLCEAHAAGITSDSFPTVEALLAARSHGT